MKANVRFEDAASHEVLYEGAASLDRNGNSVEIRMKSPEVESIWKILPRGIVMENRSEITSIVRLFDSKRGRAHILSPYGEMEAELSDVSIERLEDAVQIGYAIEDQHFSFSLSWQTLTDPAASASMDR